MSLETNSGGRVLVADDSELHRQLVTQLLTQKGYEVDAACDGVEAIEWFRRRSSYALIFMDCRMPTLDGFSAVKTIRRIEAHQVIERHVPIVALTVVTDEVLCERCQRVGMDDCLTKPLGLDALRETLRRYERSSPRST